MGVFPPSPTTTSSMPALINPTLQPVGCSQIQNMQTNVPNMPSSQPTQPILSTYSDSTGNYKQQMPQPQLYQQQHQYQQVQPPSQQVPEYPTHQLANILQSLDIRLGKIETQLSYQNQQLGQQNSRIHNIESHVEQITVLKQNMSAVQSKVYSLETDMKHMKSKHTDYDHSIQTYSSLCDSVLKSQSSINDRIDQLNDKIDFLLSSEIENIKTEHNDLKEDFLDTKCRQMGENLIFTGISEAYLRQNEYENCENTLTTFLSEHMNIHDNIKFDRVHRLGRFKRHQVRPRPIIAKFHDFKTKEMVKRKAPETLKNTPFGVREQYPEEYERRRKVLYPKMKAAKSNQQNRVKLVKDTLYINNEKFICGQNDMPVKVANQDPRSQNMNVRTIPNRRQEQTNSRTYTNRQQTFSHEQQPTTQQCYNGYQHSQQCSTREPATNPGRVSSSSSNTISFESRNRFTYLSQNDNGDRYYAGKTKASSPLDSQMNSKKQRDDISEQSFMELTPSPQVSSPVNPNSSLSNEMSNSFTPSQNINTETSSGLPVENPQVLTGAQNHESHERHVEAVN